MAARIFGTAFEVGIERKDTFQVTTTKKSSVVRVQQFKNPTDEPKVIPLDANGHDARSSIDEGSIIFYYDMRQWAPLPDTSKYFSTTSFMEGTLTQEFYHGCLEDTGKLTDFASPPRENHYVGVQICPECVADADHDRCIEILEIS
ncbi:hypothetical protein BU24DRAFT_414093 [Aaosphaeria arxii CBS 175.79]|uniref:Uncharacterized protein n=1 Tax=Aaosphaeria arxii CBS 175.79 TaxID=1450172 RepID=A0A6A5XCL3_9PLEO|nr:uncharacterized protein BU24DRAFT_414093 [Aaosphaeria arxii CBS 175.79]KAF2010514.1 hypothetical protein BU24DRAFT_414093 [Aaosphaeria arxii CBS 175.79]